MYILPRDPVMAALRGEVRGEAGKVVACAPPFCIRDRGYTSLLWALEWRKKENWGGEGWICGPCYLECDPKPLCPTLRVSPPFVPKWRKKRLCHHNTFFFFFSSWASLTEDLSLGELPPILAGPAHMFKRNKAFRLPHMYMVAEWACVQSVSEQFEMRKIG